MGRPKARILMLKRLLLEWFTWWNGTTFMTRVTLWRRGERVGEDEFGNVYYRLANDPKLNPAFTRERRWVVYNGYAEATTIPPGWWGWMHHTTDTPPTEDAYQPKPWQKPHRPNMTGTARAYRPKGSTLAEGRRPAATGDYKAWTPGE
jgi:NADH:ubiquinone oxidoreductase subunit